MSICEVADQTDKMYGCLFCRVGCEDNAVSEIMRNNPDMRVIFPVKVRYNRGKNSEERVPLFPGYVFFCGSSDINIAGIIQNRYVYKVLTYGNNDWHLAGNDKEIAKKLFHQNGVIDFSRAYYENERIHIIEGFLKEFEGCILKVNHRKQTALVNIDFYNISLNVWVGFELVEK